MPPVGLSGDVHLLLSSDDAVYIDTGLDYTSYLQPTIFSGISPEAGPKRGGTRVTLTGNGLAAFVSELQPLSQQEMTQVIPLIALDYPRFALYLDGIWIDLDGIWIDRAPLDAAGRALLVGWRLHFHPDYCRKPSQQRQLAEPTSAARGGGRCRQPRLEPDAPVPAPARARLVALWLCDLRHRRRLRLRVRSS